MSAGDEGPLWPQHLVPPYRTKASQGCAHQASCHSGCIPLWFIRNPPCRARENGAKGVKPLGVAHAELAQWGRTWCSYRTLLGCGERKAAPHKTLSLSLIGKQVRRRKPSPSSGLSLPQAQLSVRVARVGARSLCLPPPDSKVGLKAGRRRGWECKERGPWRRGSSISRLSGGLIYFGVVCPLGQLPLSAGSIYIWLVLCSLGQLPLPLYPAPVLYSHSRFLPRKLG
jgi:hypothetical protein